MVQRTYGMSGFRAILQIRTCDSRNRMNESVGFGKRSSFSTTRILPNEVSSAVNQRCTHCSGSSNSAQLRSCKSFCSSPGSGRLVGYRRRGRMYLRTIVRELSGVPQSRLRQKGKDRYYSLGLDAILWTEVIDTIIRTDARLNKPRTLQAESLTFRLKETSDVIATDRRGAALNVITGLLNCCNGYH